MQKTVLLILYALLGAATVSAQNHPLVFKNITRGNGLPVDEITTLAQDSTGFIWIGTLEGLFRYDGFNFKNFSFDGTPNAYATTINRMIVDKKGRLWLASLDGGISCLSNTGRVLKRVSSSTSPLVSESANYATDIKEDPEGNIWWTTIDGLFCFEAKDSSIHCYKITTDISRGNAFNQLVFDTRGRLWVSGFLGLKLFNKVSKQFEPGGETAAERAFFSGKKDFATAAIHNNSIWYSNWNPELGNFNRSTGKTLSLYSGLGSSQPDFNRMANTFFVDSKNALWIGTGRGLHWIKKQGEPIHTFQHDPQNNFSLVHDQIKAIMEDREGNFWFATRKGISVVRPYASSVMNISSNSLSVYPFAGKEINDIINADDSTILIGTHESDGIYQTDLQFNSQKHWSFNNVIYDWIWRYFDDTLRQRIFISTQEGMLLYDKRTRNIEKAKDTVFHSFHPVSSFIANSDSIVWMTRFWNKLMRYNLVTGKHKIYDFTKMGEKPHVLYFSRYYNNQLWIIAHQSGLWRFDEKSERIVERIEKKNDASSLKETIIFCFLDLGEHFLIGYRSKGLSLYHKRTKTFRHITKQDGLVSNSIRDGIRVKDGTVWIATKNGLTHYYPETGVLHNYNYQSGILHNDFIRIRQLDDGRIVAGSTMGLVCFDPSKLDEKPAIAPPIITDIGIYGNNFPLDQLTPQKDPIGISYGDNYFAFEFISLHYSNPQEVEYAYKLEGLDDDWVSSGSRRFASYSRVPGGHYAFRVRARLPNGSWIENKAPLEIFVETAFYKRWWFYTLCLLVAAAAVYSLFRYRLHQALKVERMRTAISSDLHDEVGASLTSISLFSEMARQSTLPAHKKEEYLQRIGERSRDSIEQMSDIIWSINPENDNLQQMLVRLKNYAIEVTETRGINLHWNQTGKFSLLKLSMQQRKNFYLFFKEAINNAIKHAGARNIHLDLAVHADQIIMRITDDGKGFNSEAHSVGNGIKNMQRRAMELNGLTTITSANGKGTTVDLRF